MGKRGVTAVFTADKTHANSCTQDTDSSLETNSSRLLKGKQKNHADVSRQKRVSEFDERFASACNYYRFISLFLTSFLYLILNRDVALLQRAALVLVLFSAAVLAVHLYKRFHRDFQKLTLLILLEMLGIGLLLQYSGGLESPFIWYALTPLILASIHLPLFIPWIFLSLFFFTSSLDYIFISNRASSVGEVFMTQMDIMLTIVLLTLVVQLFSRLYHTMKEQSNHLQLQQQELFTTYRKVFENQQLFQALTNYQQEIVTYKRDVDIYSTLSFSLESAFPFSSAGILKLDEPALSKYLTPSYPTSIITSQYPQGNKHGIFTPVIKEVKDKWQEFFSSPVIMGKQHNWIAMPLWNDKTKLMAVFVGMLKPGAAIYRPSETLALFITFTEQVVQRLYSLHQAEQSLDHLSSLYSAAEAISSKNDPREIIDLYAAYAKALSGCEKVVFWLEHVDSSYSSPGDDQGSFYTVRGRKVNFPDECWYPKLIGAWAKMREDLQPAVKLVVDPENQSMAKLICVPVKSRSKCLGMLAALQSKNPVQTDEVIQTLTFLAELSSVTIERNLTELFADRLLVLEEQNRIANEIHDSISQNLFSIVYSLEAYLRHPEINVLSEDFRGKLYTVKDVAAVTSKEIRHLIYRLSPRHRNDKTFFKELENFVEGLGVLNHVEVDFDVEGSEEYLSPAAQNALYRITKEASNNAVRHGQCSRVSINLDITPSSSVLTISDDGKGFEVEDYNSRKTNGKLGLVNMRELSLSLQGELSIESAPQEGTTITCSLPTAPLSRET